MPKSKSAAFTLIEMILVLVISGILAAVALPKFSTNSYKNNFFYNEVLSSIHYARKLAVASGCHIQVSISGNTLTITSRTGAVCTATASAFGTSVADPVNRTTGFVRTYTGSSTFSPNSLQFYFNGLGSAYSSSTNTISNFSLTFGGRTITIVGQTGLTYGS